MLSHNSSQAEKITSILQMRKISLIEIEQLVQCHIQDVVVSGIRHGFDQHPEQCSFYQAKLLKS